ncbi:PREDICTED: 4-coumarate--CoA ligase 1-like [Nicrophorus vespilloides]|uniref:Luciferin 4-monooxygenase n=1 Tax=Nicrophorus vespilloides TaxID=110193 RepID=A0ABM1N860_NICVS|nr:PREDICTED: 4-coumarate--CoA ligase 1-like [Nicrophorus vespilloides]
MQTISQNESKFKSLGEIFFDVLKNNLDPNKIAMIDKVTKKQINYGELLDQSLKLAEELKALGVNKDELKAAFIHSKPKVMFTTQDHFEKVLVLREITDYIKNQRANCEDDCALLLNSSGTTSFPKSVVLTQRNVKTIFNYLKFPYIDINTDNVLIGMMPFYHGFGLMLVFGSIVNLSMMVILRKFNPKDYCEIIEEYNVTCLQIVPSIGVFLAKHPMIANYDFSRVKDITCGAAPLGLEVQDALEKRLNCKIRQFYGMTETSGVITLVPTGDESKIGASGKPLPWVDIKVIDIDNNEEMAQGGIGELCVKTIQNMKGYLGMDEDTKSLYWNDDYFRAGDIGYIDKDGEIFILDRLKEMIKYKAFQVSPSELEDILNSHEYIVESGVIGLPDERAGELPMAFVVKRENVDLSEEAVKEFVAGHVSLHKQLHGGVKFVKEIPKGSSGKILRKTLRQLIK